METQLAIKEEPSVALMLQAVIDKGVTPDNVVALDKLVGLYERMQDRQAEKDFSAALTDLQAECNRIKATKAVDEKADGTCRYRFAPYEHIMEEVTPLLKKHGFSITFDTRIEEPRLISICTLTHRSGHSRSNQFAVRFGKPPGSSDAQGDMSTKSYAKRGALCDALNIVIEHDLDGDDQRAEGGPITKEQVAELKRRVAGIPGIDEAAFLRFAQAAHYEAISTAMMPELEAMLARKEAKVKPGKLDEQPEIPW